MQTEINTSETLTTEKHAPVDLHKQLENAEMLTNDLKRLLVKYEGMLRDEGARDHVETLERWMESYRRGLSAAHKISATGTEWLSDMQDRFKLAAEEMHRLEGEGGAPANKEQTDKIEELIKALNRIQKVIPDMEQAFAMNEQPAVEEHA